MRAFTICEGYAAPIMRDNIDTDLIIRVERIAKLKRGELGPWALRRSVILLMVLRTRASY